MEKIEKVKENLLNIETKEKVSYLFKCLSDSTRISIIYSLKGIELTVTELTYVLSMTQSAISHQLKILRDANIVKFRKDGKEVYYSLSDEHIYSIFNQAIDHVEEI